MTNTHRLQSLGHLLTPVSVPFVALTYTLLQGPSLRRLSLFDVQMCALVVGNYRLPRAVLRPALLYATLVQISYVQGAPLLPL